MKKQIIIFFIILSLPALAQSQSQPQPVVVPLWKNGAPGFEDRKNIAEESKDWWVKSINNPSLTVFTPPEGKSNGCAVIVAPGGGFRELEAKVPVEAVLFARGKHAFNMGDRSSFVAVRNWPQRMADWMNDSGFLKQ